MLLSAVVLSCSRPLPPEFSRALDTAKASYAEGNYRAAADHFARAATLAPTPRERDEAEYLRAASLEREGDLVAADRLYARLERGGGDRAERAAFARANILLALGQEAAGFARLRAALLKFPQSGLSERAVQRLLSHVKDKKGPAAAQEECQRLLLAARGTAIEPRLALERAQLLEAQNLREAARDAYIELARRFPYPAAYWDEALYAAARLDEALGRFAAAIEHLERLLRERETSKIAGSYERPLYAAARFHAAEIYRDRLNDPDRARREFRRVFRDHSTSELRDDALFEEALIALRHSDFRAACATARLLRDEQPGSRYARCTRELCPTLAPQTMGCRAYILNRISDARATKPAKPPTPYSSSSSSSSR
jgi:tetratricopeptide (TPR) repeat protein